jgi:DNA-binding NtrC family response regulator
MSHMPEGTAVLIEDDDAVCRVIARALRACGYLVHDWPTGEAAVEFVRCHAGPIDVLITDTVLPGINGVDAAAAIREMRPGLPVLQMSGFPKNTVTAASVCGAAFHFIEKPFRADVLANAVRAIVGTTPTIGFSAQ